MVVLTWTTLWNLDELFEPPHWEKSDLSPVAGVTSLVYEGVPHQGEKTRGFAYYGVPEGSPPASQRPSSAAWRSLSINSSTLVLSTGFASQR